MEHKTRGIKARQRYGRQFHTSKEGERRESEKGVSKPRSLAVQYVLGSFLCVCPFLAVSSAAVALGTPAHSCRHLAPKWTPNIPPPSPPLSLHLALSVWPCFNSFTEASWQEGGGVRPQSQEGPRLMVQSAPRPPVCTVATDDRLLRTPRSIFCLGDLKLMALPFTAPSQYK